MPGSPSCALGRPEEVRNASEIPSSRTSESLRAKRKQKRMLQQGELLLPGSPLRKCVCSL